MLKYLIPFLAVLLSFPVLANGAADSPKAYYDFLTQKTIEDFHKGIKLYNEKKESSAPQIKKGKSQTYNLVVNNVRVNFTIVNYLNDQIYVNDRLVQKSTFGLNKTTWLNPIISTAFAEDEVTLDAETTKVLLTALGSLTNNLEEVGMMCFSGCQKDIKKNNTQKILMTLERQREECNEQLYAQDETLRKYPSYKMVSMLHSTFNPEFQSVRIFFQKVSETNSKKVKEFMTDKMVVEKKYNSCVGVMSSGTIADKGHDALEKGLSVLTSGRIASEAIQEELEKAQGVCLKMEELKTCLVTLKKNLNSINSIKRSINKSGYNAPLETLPEIRAIDR